MYRYTDDLLRLEATKPATAEVGPAGLVLVRSLLNTRDPGWLPHRLRLLTATVPGGAEYTVSGRARGGGRAVHPQGGHSRPHPRPGGQGRGPADSRQPPGSGTQRQQQVAGDYGPVLPARQERQQWGRFGGVLPSLHVQTLPRGLLAKLDIKSTYRLVPVHPDDRSLLGIQWQGGTYMDDMLPFGLRSAQKIFTAVADALEWCVLQAGVGEVDHYLDDFVTLGPAVAGVPSQP